MRLQDGVVSPGGIGYDINCGVRLLSSQIQLEEARDRLEALAQALDQASPSGVGSTGRFKLNASDFEQVCVKGIAWAHKRGLAGDADMRRTEGNGCLAGASMGAVSRKAIERGSHQLGTLGSGNHFLEVDYVEQIFSEAAARSFGLYLNCLVVQIHCGSRGFGHQVCTDYVLAFQPVIHRYGIHVMDRELVCAPLNSPEAEQYLSAMRAAANFAFVNRQLLANGCRDTFEQIFAGRVHDWHLHQVFDVAHNIGKMETHLVRGKQQQFCVHRKGATRAFGPHHPELPPEYRDVGQPVLIPGSMGTASWVLAGNEKSMAVSFGSACHGAGRVKSRSQAKREVRGETLIRDLAHRGIIIKAGSLSGAAEEDPAAYKDVDEVIEAVCGAGIARKVARLRPLIVIKG
jgi:tRNA-splicing ligase RtcB